MRLLALVGKCVPLAHWMVEKFSEVLQTGSSMQERTLGCWWNSLGNYWLRYHWDSLESLCLSHLLKSGKMPEFRCVWNSLRRCPWGTWESHGKITWVAGVNLLRSHSRGCRWHSMSRGHHRRSCTHTADHHMPQIERTKAHPSGREALSSCNDPAVPSTDKTEQGSKGEMFTGSTSSTTKQAKQDRFGAEKNKLINWQKV